MKQQDEALAVRPGQAVFVGGALKTGKTAYVKSVFPQSLYLDLADRALSLQYLSDARRFKRDLLALAPAITGQPIILDNIHTMPALLPDIQWLMDHKNYSFILCGAHQRFLDKARLMPLIRHYQLPLTFPDLQRPVDLLRVLNQGLLPAHHHLDNPHPAFKAYMDDYLRYIIQAGSMVKHLDTFNRFIQWLAFYNGGFLNYTAIARDVGVSSHTIKDYIQIIEDTFMGYTLSPYHDGDEQRQLMTTTPIFYWFDPGLASHLVHRPISTLNVPEAKSYLEHYVFLELLASSRKKELNHTIRYWRTRTGLKVDFVLCDPNDALTPIVVTNATTVHTPALRSLKAFMKQYKVKRGYVVSLEPEPRRIDTNVGTIMVYPLTLFLEKLWG